MVKRSFLLIVISIYSFSNIQAQTTETTIPFKLTSYNNILVEGILNNRDTVQLMVHTAAGSLTLTEEAVQKMKTVKFDSNADSIKSWGGETNSARVSQGNRLQIGALNWHDIEFSENKYSGQESGGKFGLNLFAGKVVELNFEKRVLIVRGEMPQKSSSYDKLKIVFEDEMMFLEATCLINGSAFPNKFLIHSGYAGAILLDDEFVSKNRIGNQIEIVGEREMKDSFGNILKTKRGMMPQFKIGAETLANVPVGFFEGAIGRQKMSIIGGEILKRFNIIIDSKREFIYLKPNDTMMEKYAVD